MQNETRSFSFSSFSSSSRATRFIKLLFPSSSCSLLYCSSYNLSSRSVCHKINKHVNDFNWQLYSIATIIGTTAQFTTFNFNYLPWYLNMISCRSEADRKNCYLQIIYKLTGHLKSFRMNPKHTFPCSRDSSSSWRLSTSEDIVSCTRSDIMCSSSDFEAITSFRWSTLCFSCFSLSNASSNSDFNFSTCKNNGFPKREITFTFNFHLYTFFFKFTSISSLTIALLYISFHSKT